jgi:hypothetical protein
MRSQFKTFNSSATIKFYIFWIEHEFRRITKLVSWSLDKYWIRYEFLKLESIMEIKKGFYLNPRPSGRKWPHGPAKSGTRPGQNSDMRVGLRRPYDWCAWWAAMARLKVAHQCSNRWMVFSERFTKERRTHWATYGGPPRTGEGRQRGWRSSPVNGGGPVRRSGMVVTPHVMEP